MSDTQPLKKFEVPDEKIASFAFGDTSYPVQGGVVSLPGNAPWVNELLTNGIILIPEAAEPSGETAAQDKEAVPATPARGSRSRKVVADETATPTGE